MPKSKKQIKGARRSGKRAEDEKKTFVLLWEAGQSRAPHPPREPAESTMPRKHSHGRKGQAWAKAMWLPLFLVVFKV